MKYLINILSISIISFTSAIESIFNQPINAHSIADFNDNDVIIDTSNFSLEYDFESKKTFDEIDIFKVFKVKIGSKSEIQPENWKYVSRKGEGYSYFQLANSNDVVEFNPFAYVNFMEIKINQNPTVNDIKTEFNGTSKIQTISIDKWWSTVQIYTAFFYAPDSSDFYINFCILAHFSQYLPVSNVSKVRASYGQKVNFY